MPKCRHEKVRNLVTMMAAQLKITRQSACKKSKGCNFDRAMENMMAMKNAVDSPLVQMEGSPLSCRFVIGQEKLINFDVVFMLYKFISTWYTVLVNVQNISLIPISLFSIIF